MKTDPSRLAALGWRPELAGTAPTRAGLVPARIVAEHRSEYRVDTGAGERSARLAGRLRHEAAGRADLPAVGDWVLIEAPADGDTLVHQVLPRSSRFSRKVAGTRTEEQVVAANVDVVWIVSALDGELNPRRLERYLVLGWESGAVPEMVLTKADLAADIEASLAQVAPVAMGVQVHVTSSVTGQGIEALRQSLRAGATVALIGSSGVGKSTLINRLAGVELQATGSVRPRDGKGRHTTTARQLIRLPGGGLVVDTPGMRELQLWDVDEGLEASFSDIEELAAGCRFSDCTHRGEPGCAVTDAVERGVIRAGRLSSYHKLQRELAHLDRRLDARAQAEETRRVRAIHRAQRDHPKYR
jgi:ribosome biogenesis GTPase / thiamine phosphate phosphatase